MLVFAPYDLAARSIAVPNAVQADGHSAAGIKREIVMTLVPLL
jgi:hypothetical protein